uniref:Retinol dehydrogenase 8 n=1 Tax=Sander lucioperca TaxID=283035 RepID=A0A8D0A6Y5_SANLU
MGNINKSFKLILFVVVYATMRNLSNGEALVEAAGRTLGRTLEIKQLDVCEDSIEACVNSLPERRVDILSNVGSATTIDERKTVMDTNFLGLVRLLKEILHDMKKRKRGHIVVISSVMGILVILFIDVYAASKFAVEGFCERLAIQALRFNLNISLIEPDPAITEFERKVYEEGLKTDLSKSDKVTHTLKIITMENPPFCHQTNALYTPMTTLKYVDPNDDLPIDTF